MVPYCLHGGDPLQFFKIEEFSKRVREDFNEGGLFESLIEKYILKNPHSLRIVSNPDPTLAEKDSKRERYRLAALSKALTDQEKESIVQEAYTLQ